MIISNSRRFIFIHISKAAGTSITRTLDQYLNWDDIVLGATDLGESLQWPYHRRFNLHKHSQAEQIKNVVGDKIWKEYFTFTIVRNPYSRTLSLYKWVKGIVDKFGYVRYFPFRIISKKKFLTWPVTKAYLSSRNFSDFIRNDKIKNDLGMKPQIEWLINENGEVIVDYIGKVEQIDNDFIEISRRIGVKANKLEIHNKSKLVAAKDKIALTDNDYEMLYSRFQRDFEIFRYDPNLKIT